MVTTIWSLITFRSSGVRVPRGMVRLYTSFSDRKFSTFPLGFMKNDAHIDVDLFDIFVKEKIYLQSAEGFLDPEQIDEVQI